MNFLLFGTLFLIPILSWGQGLIPNEKEFREISLITSIAANIDEKESAKLAEAINKNIQNSSCQDPLSEGDGKLIKDTGSKKVSKERPSISFYYKVTGPVEDMRLMDVNVDPSKYTGDLAAVVTAQNESDRSAAITALCAGKSPLEMIQYGSTLFNLLGQVYNDGLANGGVDPFSAIDPTKAPEEIHNITLQRQYNALNRQWYGGNQGWPPTAGVCRHASTLVSDFLTRCGMDAKDVSQVAYKTNEAGHATVKVVDPKSGKIYFLNWGEVKEGENPSGLTNFDIPSDTLPGRGMIIRYHDAGQAGEAQGLARTNQGVVVARLLHVADDEVDYTTYLTTEAGIVFDLGTKRKLKIKSGNWKEVDQQVLVGLIDARNSGLQGEEKMQGFSTSYKREAVKYFGDHLYWKNRLQTSVGLFTNEDASIEGSGFGITHRQGMGVGGVFGTDSKTRVELGGDVVGEFYSFENQYKTGGDKLKNREFATYMVGTVTLAQDGPENYVELKGNIRISAQDDMQNNDKKNNPAIGVYNPQVSFVYARKFENEKSVGLSTVYVGSFDRQFVRSELFYADNEKKFNASGGFTVIKTAEDNNFVYSVVKINKEFELRDIDLKAGINFQQSLTTQGPAMVTGTVIISPNWFTRNRD